MAAKEFKIFKLNFTSPLHLSTGKSEYDKSAQVLHSDTLKSAILSCAFQMGYSKEITDKLLDSVVISSAYPYCGEEYFFPKPFSKIQTIENVDESKQSKQLKRIQFIGKSYFEDLLNGGTKEYAQNHFIDNGKLVSDHSHFTGQKDKSFFKSSISQRVRIAPDYLEDATPFYMERIFFKKNAGLFFMVSFNDESVKQTFKNCLSLLSDNGIGTDRGVGNGFFDMQEENITLNLPNVSTHLMNLSLYCPEQKELDEETLKNSAWHLTKRGGYIAAAEKVANRSLKKKSIYMFSEGSVFLNSERLGKIVDLKPDHPNIDHPVWRDGRSIFIPIQPITNG